MPNEIGLADGRSINAELVVWAAGVKAPAFLQNIDGLETNASNQLVVRQTLQTTRDENIFVIGDCAACPWPEKNGPEKNGPEKNGPERTALVPPRAQAAHQQATHLSKQLRRRLAGQAVEPWHYRDFGSLVSLGQYSTVGSLMGKLVGSSFFIEGYFARFMYVSLYKMHEYALHGLIKVALDTLVRLITRRTEPQVKLH
jgi:NADH:quinone reductase (non-electrogenic)